MNAAPEHVARAHALLAELETLAELNGELVALSEGARNLAGYPADTSVALLSLMPFVHGNAGALDFLSDAMTAASATLQQVIGLQATLGRICETLDARLAVLRTAVASVKVPE